MKGQIRGGCWCFCSGFWQRTLTCRVEFGQRDSKGFINRLPPFGLYILQEYLWHSFSLSRLFTPLSKTLQPSLLPRQCKCDFFWILCCYKFWRKSLCYRRFCQTESELNVISDGEGFVLQHVFVTYLAKRKVWTYCLNMATWDHFCTIKVLRIICTSTGIFVTWMQKSLCTLHHHETGWIQTRTKLEELLM